MEINKWPTTPFSGCEPAVQLSHNSRVLGGWLAPLMANVGQSVQSGHYVSMYRARRWHPALGAFAQHDLSAHMRCDHCKYEFDTVALKAKQGTQVICPSCGETTTVRYSFADSLKDFTSLKQFGTALDSPDYVLIVQLVGRAFKSQADSTRAVLSD